MWECSDDSVEVDPAAGIGRFQFGMTIQELKDSCNVLDGPDLHEDGMTRFEVCNGSVFLDFSPDYFGRLAVIEVSSSRFTLFSLRLVGMTQMELGYHVRMGSIPGLKLDLSFEGSNLRCFESDELGVQVWLDRGLVYSFCLFGPDR